MWVIGGSARPGDALVVRHFGKSRRYYLDEMMPWGFAEVSERVYLPFLPVPSLPMRRSVVLWLPFYKARRAGFALWWILGMPQVATFSSVSSANAWMLAYPDTYLDKMFLCWAKRQPRIVRSIIARLLLVIEICVMARDLRTAANYFYGRRPQH